MHTKIVEQIIEFSLKVIDVSPSEKNLSQINREKDQNITKNKRIFSSLFTQNFEKVYLIVVIGCSPIQDSNNTYLQ